MMSSDVACQSSPTKIVPSSHRALTYERTACLTIKSSSSSISIKSEESKLNNNVGDAGADDDDIKPHRKIRQQRMQDLRSKLINITNSVMLLSKTKYDTVNSSSKNEHVTKRTQSLFIECHAPNPWLLGETLSDYNSDVDDDDDDDDSQVSSSRNHNNNEMNRSPSILILDVAELRPSLVVSSTINEATDSKFADWAQAMHHHSPTATSSSVIFDAEQQHLPSNRDNICFWNLKDYKFEAIACIVDELTTKPEPAPPADDPADSQHANKNSKKRAASRKRALKSNPFHDTKVATSPRKKSSPTQQEFIERDEAAATSRTYQVLEYMDIIDTAQDWWDPENARDYQKILEERILFYPRCAEQIYELATLFGLAELRQRSERAMLWQWGVEIHRQAWSLPTFTWLASKLRLAGKFGNEAMVNVLLIFVEKMRLSSNELLQLYSRLQCLPASTCGIVRLYIEREVFEQCAVTIQRKRQKRLEVILQHFILKAEEADLSTLVDAVIVRTAVWQHANRIPVLRDIFRVISTDNLRDAEKFAQLVCRWRCEKISQLLSNPMLQNAEFSLQVSRASIEYDEVLTAVQTYAVTKKVALNDDASTQQAEIVFTCSLLDTSTNFAIKLARAMNMVMDNVDNKTSDDNDSEIAVIDDDETSGARKRRSRSKSGQTTGAKRRSTNSEAAVVAGRAKTKKKKARGADEFDPLYESDCAFINWSCVHIRKKYTASDSESDADAEIFQTFPFMYMPSESQISIRRFYDFLPLGHPLICILLHTLYDNNVEKLYNQVQSLSEGGEGGGGPKLCYQLRLTARKLDELFGRFHEWQTNGLNSGFCERKIRQHD